MRCWAVRVRISPLMRTRSRMVKAIESRISARLPPTWCWMAMAVVISSRSSERTRRTRLASACSKRQAQVDLADDAAELGRDRRLRLAHDHLDGLQERRAGAQRVGEERDRVGQAAVEGLEALALAAVEPEARQPPADHAAPTTQASGLSRAGKNGLSRIMTQRHAEIAADADGQELGRLAAARSARASSRARLAPQSRALDDAVEVGQRGATLERQLADRSRSPGWLALRLCVAADGVALEARVDVRAAAGRRRRRRSAGRRRRRRRRR